MAFNQGAPLRRRERLRLPALSFWPGHRPAQATRCPAVEKRLMSGPISDRIVSADNRLTPGIEASRSINPEKGGLVGLVLLIHRGNPRLNLAIDDQDRRLQLLWRRLQTPVAQRRQFARIANARDHRLDDPTTIGP